MKKIFILVLILITFNACAMKRKAETELSQPVTKKIKINLGKKNWTIPIQTTNQENRSENIEASEEDSTIEELIPTILISMKSNYNHEDLIEAIKNKNLKYIKKFVKNNPSVNYKDKYCCTPLMYAARHFPKALKILISAGAKLFDYDSEGWTALMWACEHSSNSVKILVNAGAKVNVSDKYGKTPLMLAAQHQSSEIIKFLIDRGANIKSKDKNGHNALVYAQKRNFDREACSLLL